MKKWDFEMYSWKLDFHNMEGQMSISDYGGDCDYRIKLYIKDGHLCYRDGCIYKVITNTTSHLFNKALTKAWTDFCFERVILNHKMEKS